MKRTIATLVILSIVGAAVFVVGYLPLRLENGSTAVLYSKTSGWETQPIRPGVFAWRWELLIPTNATIHHFPEDFRTVQVRSDGILPSAEVYAPLLEGAPAFRQEIRLRVRYRPSPETVARSAPSGLRAENIESWYENLDDEIRSAAIVFTGSTVVDLVEDTELIVPVSAVSERVTEMLRSRFSDLEVQSVVVESLELPDPELYRIARQSYRTVQEARENALVEAAQDLAHTQAAADQRAATLQEYGRIFSDYPVLLEYLEITARTGRDPLNIESVQQIQTTVED